MGINILKGKKGIIFGALDNSSIAWKTAERVYDEGGEFILTNAPVSIRMGSINDLAKKTNSDVIPADATNIEDLENLINTATSNFGGKLDFVLHSIGIKEKPLDSASITAASKFSFLRLQMTTSAPAWAYFKMCFCRRLLSQARAQ